MVGWRNGGPSALRWRRGAAPFGELGGVLISASLLPQGSYWSSNHSEQGWLAGDGGGTGRGAGTGVTTVPTVVGCGLASSRVAASVCPLASKGPWSWGTGFAEIGKELPEVLSTLFSITA